MSIPLTFSLPTGLLSIVLKFFKFSFAMQGVPRYRANERRDYEAIAFLLDVFLLSLTITSSSEISSIGKNYSLYYILSILHNCLDI